jgi:signal peptidase I
VSLPVPEQAQAEEPTADPPPEKSRRSKSIRLAIEWGGILVVAVVAAILIRSFVVQPFYIPSGSMEPTLQIHDRVLVNKLAYDFHSVHRGDIVVFSRPPNDAESGINDLIKRVIGLSGETISTRLGHVYINGRVLNEPWLPKDQLPVPAGGCPLTTTKIPPGDYYVMGDNRGDSADSRCFGPISGHLIIGRAFIRVWPLSRIGFL